MNDIVTIVGRVATDPTQGQIGGGATVTNFRMASTHRRFDNATQTWTDSGTNWFSVAAFRQLGEHAKASLRTGDSIIVTGKLRIRTWESNGKQGTSVDIEADAIGHDLRWGTSAFLARSRANPTAADQATASPQRQSAEGIGEPDPDDLIDASDDGASADLDLSWAEPPAGVAASPAAVY